MNLEFRGNRVASRNLIAVDRVLSWPLELPAVIDVYHAPVSRPQTCFD